jgi:hypothetical protein
MMALFDKFALRRGVGLTNDRTCPAGFYSKLSYKGREDCQFCAPIPDRHEICTGRYVSTELRQGAFSVPDAGADITTGFLGMNSGRYNLVSLETQRSRI